MKDTIISALQKTTKLKKEEISNLIEIPPDPKLGDYAFPTFTLAKKFKKSPADIAQDLASKIKSSKKIEKVQSIGSYINFFINSKAQAQSTLSQIIKQKDKYGSHNIGKNKTIVLDMSSPQIAKPFGIGHLRSTIIGNSVSNISKFLGYKTVKINYLGDWGTPFGKIIAGYEKWGSERKLKAHPIKHLYEIYLKTSADPKFDGIGREYFKKLEAGNKSITAIWKKFRNESIKDFKKIYALLGVDFDVYSGESVYNGKMGPVIKHLESKKLLERSDNALIVDLEKHNLGVGLIQKTDGTTLYLTRDITAAQHRKKKYKFHKLFYEVGSEQTLHFKQLFKILELSGYKWAKDCVHISHGLYLDKDKKKFSTRKGKTIFMTDVLNETISIAKKELSKRQKLPPKELNERALAITRAAIFYGDLKNHRASDAVFDINRFLSFEGNTGPYLLYTYARAKSILRKAKHSKSYKILEITPIEKALITQLANFPSEVHHAYNQLAPNIIANYAHQLAQNFNEFYHSQKVIDSQNEQFKLALVSSTAQVLKNALSLLTIPTLERM